MIKKVVNAVFLKDINIFIRGVHEVSMQCWEEGIDELFEEVLYFCLSFVAGSTDSKLSYKGITLIMSRSRFILSSLGSSDSMQVLS